MLRQCLSSKLILGSLVGLLFSCASRAFEDSVPQPDPSRMASAAAWVGIGSDNDQSDEVLGINAMARASLMSLSGREIHESGGRSSGGEEGVARWLKGYGPISSSRISATVPESTSRVLSFNLIAQGAAPIVLEPVGGFDSPIGSESYVQQLDNQTQVSTAGLPSDSGAGHRRGVSLWLQSAATIKHQGFPRTGAIIESYLDLSDQGDRRTVRLQLSPEDMQAALVEMRVWARSQSETDRHRRVRRSLGGGLLGLSLGERMILRNRAAIQIALVRDKEDPNKDRTNEVELMRAAAQVKTTAGVHWTRTHAILRQASGTDWGLAMPEMSLIAYTFGHVREQEAGQRELVLVSYLFAYGLRSWSSSTSSAFRESICGGKSWRRVRTLPPVCQVSPSTESPNGVMDLSEFASLGLAAPVEFTGYSPVIVSIESVGSAPMSAENLLLLGKGFRNFLPTLSE